MIRQEAAKRLARQLLEQRISSRVTPLSDEFISAVAKMIMTYVANDELAQRLEVRRDEPIVKR
jgi:hypothetical protein